MIDRDLADEPSAVEAITLTPYDWQEDRTLPSNAPPVTPVVPQPRPVYALALGALAALGLFGVCFACASAGPYALAAMLGQSAFVLALLRISRLTGMGDRVV